jgi:hypothetical protein
MDYALDACLECDRPTTGKYQGELRALWSFWDGAAQDDIVVERWCSVDALLRDHSQLSLVAMLHGRLFFI